MGREMTLEKWMADERESAERKFQKVRVMADNGGMEIEKKGWFDGKLPLQYV